MLHQPVPKSLPRFHCPLTSPIFNTHLRKSTTLPKQPHKHGREEGYGEDRATSSARRVTQMFYQDSNTTPQGAGRRISSQDIFLSASFSVLQWARQTNSGVGGIFRGINARGAQHKRAGSSDLLVSRPWSLHRLCRELGSKAELFPPRPPSLGKE